MKILIVAATELEVGDLINVFFDEVDFLFTGIGTPNTIFKLMDRLCEKRYDLVVNIGIAGSFSEQIKTGELVRVDEEIWGDLGFEDKNKFIPLADSEIGSKQISSFKSRNSFKFLNSLMSVKSITVNSSSGSLKTIENRNLLFNAEIENMEGASVFLVCSEKKTPFVEIRAISNYITERDAENWNIDLAVRNLNLFVKSFIIDLLKNKLKYE